MSTVYNTIGSLNYIRKHLLKNNIREFHSIQDLQRFQRDYATNHENLIANSRNLLIEEQNKILSEINALEYEIANEKNALQRKFNIEIERLRLRYDELADAEKTVIQEFSYSFKALFTLIRINYLESFANAMIYRAIRHKAALLEVKRRRAEYLKSDFENELVARIKSDLNELERRRKVIDEINTYIYGAIGEQKVAAELALLSEAYTVINDFSYSFSRPVYYSHDNSYIKSIQIDHLVISPGYIFLIETKNWSKDSMQNMNLRSPVEQIRRTSYALHNLLQRSTGSTLKPHYWGDRKIPIRNVIVLMNHKPQEEFNFVKILTVDDLLGYMEYHKPTWSPQETQKVADYLVNSCDALRISE